MEDEKCEEAGGSPADGSEDGSGSEEIRKQDSGIGQALDISDAQSPQCSRHDSDTNCQSSASESGMDSLSSPSPNSDDVKSPKPNPDSHHSAPSTSLSPNLTDIPAKNPEASKRVTADGSDDEDSPKSKRHSPGRSGDTEPMVASSSPMALSQTQHVETAGEQDVLDEAVSSENMTTDTTAEEPSSPDPPSSYARRFLADSNSDSTESDDSDNDDTGEDNEDEEDDDEDDDGSGNQEVQDAVLAAMSKPLPKPNWFVLPELTQRQYGPRPRQSLVSFNCRLQASLEMVKRLTLVEQMKYHEGCVNSLCFNRIGTLLASGSDDLNIVLWNWQRGRPSLIYESGHRSNVFQAKFMPFSGDCHVVSCARDGQVRLAELSLTGVCKATRKLAAHRGSAHKLALEMDSASQLLSCGEDAVTFLIDLREDKPHRLVTTKENDKKVPLYSIHSNPCNPMEFCVGGRDHFVRVYDKRKISEEVDGGVLKRFCPDHLLNSEIKANVTCACFNYNGTEILGTYNDEDIYLFDNTMSDGANFTHRYSGHRNNATVKGVNFYGPRSEYIVSGSDCGNIYFWDKRTESIVNFQEGDEAGVINVLEPHPLLPVLATSGLDHEVKLWMPHHNYTSLNYSKLRQTVHKNQKDRQRERQAEPEQIGGQMLWFLMHHFRNSARRRMRAEGLDVSSSDDDDDEQNSDDEEASREMQCAQS